MNKSDCISHLVPRIMSDVQNNEIVVLCISGRSCSGKSTLSDEFKSVLNNCGCTVEVLCEDSWYKDLEDIPRGLYGFFNMEDESAFCIDEYKDDVRTLIRTGCSYMPIYNISRNQRVHKEQYVLRPQVLILEGLHTINIFEKIDKSDLSVYYVYLDTPFNVCLSRRVNRDTCFLDLSAEKISRVYTDVIENHYSKYISLLKGIVIGKRERGFMIE